MLTVSNALKFIRHFKNPSADPKALETLLLPSSKPCESLEDACRESGTLLSVAGMIEADLRIENSVVFARWLRQRYGKLGLNQRGKEILRLLRCLTMKGARVATTAFDGQLARGTSLEAVSYSDDYIMGAFVRREENTILHLHGHFKSYKDVIFTLL